VSNKQVDFLQAAPEAPIVAYNAPKYTESEENRNGLKVKYDAVVTTIPNTNGYSVHQIRKLEFDCNYLKGVMDYFEPNARWIEELEWTQTRVMAQMAIVYQNSDITEPEVAAYLSYLEDLLKTAPDDKEVNDFSLSTIKSNEQFCTYAKNADGTYSSFIGSISGNTFQYMKDADVGIIRESNLEENDYFEKGFSSEPQITQEYAIDAATKVITDLNIDSNLTLRSIEKAVGYKAMEPVTNGWALIFTRSCNGLPSYYSDGYELWENSPEPSYIAPWAKECLFVFVNEAGVFHFDLRGAGQFDCVLRENVDLLPFSELKEHITKQLTYQHAYRAKNVSQVLVDVEEINMGCSMINTANDTNIGRMIPTWQVCYDLKIDYEDATFVQYHLSTLFNAIDGSYIEPRVEPEIYSLMKNDIN
jgi:hypothetical protein